MHNEILTAENLQKNKIELILTKYVNPSESSIQFNANIDAKDDEP